MWESIFLSAVVFDVIQHVFIHKRLSVAIKARAKQMSAVDELDCVKHVSSGDELDHVKYRRVLCTAGAMASRAEARRLDGLGPGSR